MKCQNKKGFDFAVQNNCRARDTFFKDAGKHTHVTDIGEFDPKVMMWVPTSIQAFEMYVHPFKKALDCLLTKTNLVVQQNISLPDARNSYSFEHCPPVDFFQNSTIPCQNFTLATSGLGHGKRGAMLLRKKFLSLSFCTWIVFLLMHMGNKI